MIEFHYLKYIFETSPGSRYVAKQDKNGFCADSVVNESDIKLQTDVDFWLAPAVFLDPTRGRKQANVLGAKWLWLDIDVGEEKGYKSLEQAFEALTSIDLRPTLVVFTGHGYHCYYELVEFTEKEMWTRLAVRLRQYCVNKQILADHQVTCDISRLLRIPGTMNCKNPAQLILAKVVLHDPSSVYSYQSLDALLPPVIKNKREIRNVSEFNANQVYLPSDAGLVGEKCAQVKRFLTGEIVTEPVWYALAGVLNFCEGGRDIFHQASSLDSRYDSAQTEEKFEHWMQAVGKPATCEHFRNINPAGCQGCPFTVSTPTLLGIYNPPAQQLSKDIEDTTERPQVLEQSIPGQQGQFQVGQAGVWFIHASDSKKHRQVSQYPLIVTRIFKVQHPGAEASHVLDVSWWVGDTHSAAMIDTEKLDSVTFASYCNKQLIPYENINLLSQYLKACAFKMVADKKVEVMHVANGWTDDHSFVLGNLCISETGHQKIRAGGEYGISQEGSKEAWVDAIKLIFKDEQAWASQYTLLAILGSPLYALMGEQVGGSCLSLTGQSGVGKTLIAHVGLSAFGNPKKLSLSHNSTYNSVMEMIAKLRNLPVMINEFNLFPEKERNDLVMSVANGESKRRLDRSAKLNSVKTFANLTLLTSNYPLLDSDWKLNEAMRRRVIELELVQDNSIPLSDAHSIYRICTENFGHIGVDLIDFYVKHRDSIKQQIDELFQLYVDAIERKNRFLIWQLVCADIAFTTLKKLGVLSESVKVSLDKIINKAVHQIKDIASTKDRCADVMHEYILLNWESFLKVNSNEQIFNNPRMKCMGKMVEKSERVRFYIPVSLMNEQLIKRQIPKKEFRSWLGTEPKIIKFGIVATRAYVWDISHTTFQSLEKERVYDT